MTVLLFSFAVAAIAADGNAGLLRQRAEVVHRNVPRQVLAFYYDWYGNPTVSGKWVHWENVDDKNKRIASTAHYPALGAYDSHDPKIIEQHFQEATNAGITGFIVTWWGQGDFHDQTMPLLLKAANRHHLNITAYFETVRDNDALKDVLYLLQKYGSDPAWLKVDGKPVLFIYGRAVNQIKLDGWLKVIAEANTNYPGGAVFIGDQISTNAAKIFDGIHTYNITSHTAGKMPEQTRAWAHKTFPDWVGIAGPDRIACLTIIPGYDDTSQSRPPPRPLTERWKGHTYEVLWEEAMAADPDWILITSWNEWHEGSEIEPSFENGDQALKTTRRFAPKFLASRPRGK